MSYEEAAEFWDGHDTADYPDAFEDEPVELQADFRKRRFEVEVEEDLVGALRERARRSGISVRQLTSELLRRQLDSRDRVRQVEPNHGMGIPEQGPEMDELGALAAAHQSADDPLLLFDASVLW